MKHKNTVLTFVFSILIFIIAIVYGFYFSRSNKDAPTILLPEKGENLVDIQKNIYTENLRIIDEIGIDTTNVKNLLSQLKRLEQYNFTSKTEVFSQNSLGELQSLFRNYQGFVLSDLSKVTTFDVDTPISHTIIDKNSIYFWKNGSKDFKTLGKGSFLYDDIFAMPTYENLLDYDEFHHVEIDTNQSNPLLVVEYFNMATDTLERYNISISNGLLQSATFEKNGVPICDFSIVSLEVGNVDPDVFTLPDGTILKN